MFYEPTDVVYMPQQEDSSLTLALDDFIDGMGEAEMALEHVGRLVQEIKSKQELTPREFKFSMMVLEGWRRYLKMPRPLKKISLESTTPVTRYSIALEESEGFFASIWQGIKNVFEWIVNAIKDLFGMEKDGGGDGGSGLSSSEVAKVNEAAKNPEGLATKVANSAKKRDGMLGIPSMKMLGVTDAHVTFKQMLDAAAFIQTNSVTLVGSASLIEGICTEVAKLLDTFKNKGDSFNAADYKRAYDALNAEIGKLEKFFAGIGKADPEESKTLGTDEGQVYKVPFIKGTVSLLVKFSPAASGTSGPPRITSKMHQVIPDKAATDLDASKFSRTEAVKVCETLDQITSSTREYVTHFRKVKKTIDKVNSTAATIKNDILASAPEERRAFAAAMSSFTAGLVSLSRVMFSYLQSSRHMTRMLFKIVDSK